MARSVHLIAFLLAGAACGLQALAQPEPMPERKRRGDREHSPEFENVRKALDALTPEQRKRFQENFWRWANLSPEEKKQLRDREDVRKKMREQEVEMVIQETGLQLEGERRELFMKRYGEERRKIEEQLRKEMMEKRRPLLKDLAARLKEEFSNLPAATPAAVPATPEPANP